MLSAFQKGLSSAIRVSGKAFDSIGQKLEVNPYVDTCMLYDHLL